MQLIDANEINSIDDVVRHLLESVSDSVLLSPYAIAKIYNDYATIAGVPEVRPQMMYNYSANGMIVKGSKKHNEHRYTKAETYVFLVKFVPRQLLKHS